jgi:hypothetical protein
MPSFIFIGCIVFALAGVKIWGFAFELHMALATLPCTTVLASDSIKCAKFDVDRSRGHEI